MKRSSIGGSARLRTALVLLACLGAIAIASPASAGSPPLDKGLRVGERMPNRYMGWLMGSSTNPLFQPEGFCGEMRGDKFFLNVASAPGTQHAECTIPAGTPLIMTPGGAFVWATSETDEELVALREEYFAGVRDAKVVLDGRRLRQRPPIVSAPFDVHLQPGSFLKQVEPAFADVDTARVADAGYYTRVLLSAGDHVLVIRDIIDIPGDDSHLFRYRFVIHSV